jgi:hypothetical protein
MARLWESTDVVEEFLEYGSGYGVTGREAVAV